MEKKAEAYAKYNKAAVAEMMIKVLPDIAGKVAEPLGQIDKITIIGGGEGGSNGVDQIALPLRPSDADKDLLPRAAGLHIFLPRLSSLLLPPATAP